MLPETWNNFPAWNDLPIEERRRRLAPLQMFLDDLDDCRAHGQWLSIMRTEATAEPCRRFAGRILGREAA